MRPTRALLVIAAFLAALFLASCGGSGIGTSFGHNAGIYFVDSGRMVWIADMTGTRFVSLDSTITGVTDVVNGTVDAGGHIYLIDGVTSSIVRFDDIFGDGKIVIGSHGAGKGQFLNPVRVNVDPHGFIYVIDRDRNQLIRFSLDGSVWDTIDLSPWFVSSNEPDLVVDTFGHVFMAGGTQIVRLKGFTATGALTYGAPGTGTGQFNFLTGICLDDQGRIYAADGTNNRIVRINDITGAGWATFGTSGAGVGQFNIAFGVGVDHNGLIYVGDRNNHRLVRVDDMTGANWTELDSLSTGAFGTVLSVFPHLPTF